MNIDPVQFLRMAEDLIIENDDLAARHHEENSLQAARVARFLAILEKARGLALQQKHRLRHYFPEEKQEAVVHKSKSLAEELRQAATAE